MAWLDRDRTPAMFAITTSVISSAISFTVGNLLLSGVSKNALLAWVAVIFVVVALVSWLAIQALRRNRRRSQRAFLIVSAFDQKYHVASFVQQLHNAMDRVDIDLVLKVPDRDYDASAQSHHIERTLRKKKDYMGGVIFAGEVQELREDLRRFCLTSGLPVVFTDLEPYTEADAPPRSVYVGYKTGDLGQLAGRWLIEHLHSVRRPRILIIASRDHSERQRACREVLEGGLKNATVQLDESCDFIRARAYDRVLRYLKNLDSRQCLHAIFCTNDEMALGAVDALTTAPSPATKSTVVIGVDGVAEARALIDSGSSPLRATVVQNTHELALGIVEVLVKMHRGQQVPKRKILEASVYQTAP